MVGVNGIFYIKLKSSSLVEVLAASVIIMIVLGISTSIFFSVISSSKNFQTIRGGLILSQVTREVQKEQKLFDEEFDIDDFHVIKEVKPYGGMKDVFILHLEIYNSENKLIDDRRELILNQ